MRWLVLPLVASSLITGCARGEKHEPAASARPSAPAPSSAHETLPPDSPTLGAPVYDLEMTLTDQDGQRVALDVYQGHPVVISMFYGTCPYACPTLISDIKRLDKSLDADKKNDLRVLLVSFDPERDTVQKLAELHRAHGLDKTRFKLCRASEAKVRDLAAVLGIKYRRLSNGAFNHSSVITLLDRAGESVLRIDGLNQPMVALADAVQKVPPLSVR